MAFFQKLKSKMFKSSSKIDEGLEAIVEDGGATDTPETVDEVPVDQVMDAPELAERGVVQEVEHETVGKMRIVASPIKLSKTPARVYFAPRPLGADGDNPDWL